VQRNPRHLHQELHGRDLCARGAGANFDAAVATLKPGTRWANTTPDGTTILAPPHPVTPAGQLWKYGDASGVKKYATGAVSVGDVTVPFKTYSKDSASFESPDAAFTQVPIDFKANQVWLITGQGAGMFQVQGDSGSALCDANNRLVGFHEHGRNGKHRLCNSHRRCVCAAEHPLPRRNQRHRLTPFSRPIPRVIPRQIPDDPLALATRSA